MKRWLKIFAVFGLMVLATAVWSHRQQVKERRLARFHEVRVGMRKGGDVGIMGEAAKVVFHRSDEPKPGLIMCFSPGVRWTPRTTYFHVRLDSESRVVKTWTIDD